MPRNFAPGIVVPTAELQRGLLLFIPDYDSKTRDAGSYKSMQFQYNPETVTRTRQGEWTSDHVRAGTRQDRTLQDGHRGGGLYAKSEVISFKLVFDSSELALRDEGPSNVLPELGFLEQVALGGDEPMKTETTTQNPTPQKFGASGNPANGKPPPPEPKAAKPTYKTKIHGTAPSELLLVLGPRTFPVVLTSLTIEEQRFNPAFEPIRAVCDCKFRVLEVQEVKNNKPAQVAFTELLRQRMNAATQVVAGENARVSAIVSKLEAS
jgi:hypothetical protein